eukprot:GHVO01064392.1.p1 GENE.GHVO01064392.1~~GHVO01064392.1.p1  ORF type:complete len:307 (-),score=5.93 GHVO01064392.1:287-1207(-)
MLVLSSAVHSDMAYADDIVLISPTIKALESQLEICASYAEDYSILFNASKTKLIVSRSTRNNNRTRIPPKVKFGGRIIDVVNSDKHLGNLVGTSNHDIVKASTHQFLTRVNMLKCHFKWLSVDATYELFKTHCMPLYGSVLWDLSHASTELFFVAWRKSVRGLLRLPPRTHCALLSHICGDIPVSLQLASRFLKFFRSLAQSKNQIIQTCASLASGGSGTSVSKNIAMISDLFRCERRALVNRNMSVFKKKLGDLADDRNNDGTASLILDLINMRHEMVTGRNELNGVIQLTRSEIDHSIYDFCVN